ncbi:hypothetical protein NHQ30_006247 [Ciborinia camelliae]|nr:hypothetical protein NHQ30_006247 [Ciborinia camelliae]
MKFSSIVASALLLVLPAIVSAAPTSSASAVTTSDPLQIFTRDGQTCNAPKPKKTGDKATDDAAQKRYDDLMKKMSDATKAAHAGQSACPSTSLRDFDKSKDKNKRTQIKTKCVDGYQKKMVAQVQILIRDNRCVTNRKAANTACTQLGGAVDQGHLQAVTVCQNSLNTWRAKNP